MGDQINPLLSELKSDSGVHVALHPLVLLTISDYITRHTLRQQKGHVIGALMGQQNGRDITLEHAYECKPMTASAPSFDYAWFESRLQQMKDVHKAPALELVGWFSVVPTSGPQLFHAFMQEQLSTRYPEATILLGFHPETALEDSPGGKLPLTIYEANVVRLDGAGQDVEMQNADLLPKWRYKELPYSVETGEAEMIGVDYVAKGGGNAAAITNGAKEAPGKKEDTKGKGKGKGKQESEEAADINPLTKEEEELIASLTAKANAIKMLQRRIDLIKIYLEKLPPAYIAGEHSTAISHTTGDHSPIDPTILRAIQALLGRLALLVPADSATFAREILAEQNDVNLVSLLSNVTVGIKEARTLGRKFHIVDNARNEKARLASRAGQMESMMRAEEMQSRLGGRGGGIGGVGDLMV